MRCAEGEDVRMFLDSLCYMREELAAAGVPVTEKEYECAILRGIPPELGTFASHLLSSALLVRGTSKVNLNALISQICEEAERLKSRCARGESGRREETTEEVFMAAEPGERTQQGHLPQMRRRRPLGPRVLHPKGGRGLRLHQPHRDSHRWGQHRRPKSRMGETHAPKSRHHAQMVDAEPDLTRGHLENSDADVHAQFVSAEPDPWLDEDDARMHLESMQPEILMNAEVDWLQELEEAEEVEEEIASSNLQGYRVSHITTLEGITHALTFSLSRSLHHPILLRTECLPESPATETGTQAMRESRRHGYLRVLINFLMCRKFKSNFIRKWRTDSESPPLDLPPSKGEGEPLDKSMPEQIQAPTEVERLPESLRGKNLRRATGQNSQTPARALGGMAPPGTAHGRPPDPIDLHARGSTVLEQDPVDAKALVRMPQMWTPVVDEGAGAHIDPWPDLGTIHTNPDTYFEVSALPEGEQNFGLPSVDSKQAITSKIFSFSSWSLVLPLPDMPERDSRPEGAELERHNAAQRPERLKPPECVAKDPDKAGGVWPGSDPGILTCPKPTLAIEMGDIEAPNSGMVGATREAEWPLRGLATEPERRPNRRQEKSEILEERRHLRA